jgi:phosphate-selective porin OprO and OprP
VDIDPDNTKLDFDTPANKYDDFNAGWMFGGRIDCMPSGKVKRAQGDFGGVTGFASAVAAFTWNNDDDNNTYEQGQDDANACLVAMAKCDVDSVNAYGLDAAWRGHGFSVDAVYNFFDVELVEDGITSCIYDDSKTELKNWAIEGGYMVILCKFEFVLEIPEKDADNHDEHRARTSIGLNYFVHKKDFRVQATWRKNDTKDGKDGDDENKGFVQAQYVF